MCRKMGVLLAFHNYIKNRSFVSSWNVLKKFEEKMRKFFNTKLDIYYLCLVVVWFNNFIIFILSRFCILWFIYSQGKAPLKGAFFFPLKRKKGINL